jgi:homogentisate 1,2-dioxygenase
MTIHHTDEQAVPAVTLSRREIRYQSGFGNEFQTEAEPGALPHGRNSPQRVAYGLYAEQLSGSPFTAPRGTNERSWLYRIRPSVRHLGRFTPREVSLWRSAPDHSGSFPFGPQRWDSLEPPTEPVTLIDGIRTITTAGDVLAHTGMATHIYVFTDSMTDTYFYNADGEMLFVPQTGRLVFHTEFGVLDAGPYEIVVIPRGVKFRVEVESDVVRGYICENYGDTFRLPERGLIGANCLANPRDFQAPTACYEDSDRPTTLWIKWAGSFASTTLGHSPLDVVAWHGNYTPYKYDLRAFSPVGPTRFDHADPSIGTALTSPSQVPGTANVDFVLFPDRWIVSEDTFRPPWFHMNIMSEFMGLIDGQYDGKRSGFEPGGFSLHNAMMPHGPDAPTFARASTVDLVPERLSGSMAFMFESAMPQSVTAFALNSEHRQRNYIDCWADLDRRFGVADHS